MTRRLVLPLSAFALGTVGAFQFLQAEVHRRTGGPETEVLVVLTDLPPGTKLEDHMLGTKKLAASLVDRRFVERGRRRDVVGKVLGQKLGRGQYLLVGDVGDGFSASLTSQLEPGFRAYPLREEVPSPGLVAGDRVDVSLLPPGGAPELVLERVEVLRVPVVDAKSSLLRGTPILSVRPEEALELLRAEARGKLRLLPRNSADHLLVAKEKTRALGQVRAYRGDDGGAHD